MNAAEFLLEMGSGGRAKKYSIESSKSVKFPTGDILPLA